MTGNGTYEYSPVLHGNETDKNTVGTINYESRRSFCQHIL
jgi:hypothetical protein